MATERKDENTLPSVLIHSEPFFNADPITDLLTGHYHLLHSHAPAPSPLLSSARAVVIVGPSPFTAADLRRVPSAELVVATSAGTDHIDFDACRLRGIAITGIGDSFAVNGADYAVGMLIDVLRRVSAADRFVRSGLWPVNGQFPLAFKLGEKRIGIVGLGKIGAAVARRLAAFGCKITYNSRNEKPWAVAPFQYFPDVLSLASNSDALVVCCALTNETHHIIDERVMEALGKGGVVVNVGRGALVDEPVLVERLLRGELGGAGLDVFENEPDVPCELFGLDNVVLSPHSAITTPEAIESMSRLVLENLHAFFSNKPLISLIDVSQKL